MNNILLQPLKLAIHPISQTTRLKEEKNYSYILGGIILIFYFTSVIFQYQYTGRNFNFNKPDTLNIGLLFFRSIAVFILFVISNWGVTTLIEGKANFKQIWVFTSYSMVPMTVLSYAASILTHYISQDEGVFVSWLSGFGVLWFLMVAFVSLMTAHQFSFFKAVISILMTVFGMLVMVFLMLLFFSLIQQLIAFFNVIYYEILYRIQN